MDVLGTDYAILVGAGLFCIGMAGMLIQRHVVGTAIAAAVMALGVVYTAAVVSAPWDDARGDVFGVVCLLVSACLSAVIMAAAVVFASVRRDADIDATDSLKW